MEYKTEARLQIIERQMELLKNNNNDDANMSNLIYVNNELLKYIITLNQRVNELENKVNNTMMMQPKIHMSSIKQRNDDCPILSRIRASNTSP